MTTFRSILCGFAGAAAALSLCLGPAGAHQRDTHQPGAQRAAPRDSGEPAQPPVLVELFLSQSCAMCPPAAALFPKIAARDDVVALSWHVHYWNITSSTNGRWEDPFSRTAFSNRQRRYNQNIRNKSSIYTPQIVVAGERECVGGKKQKIDDLIDTAPRTNVAVTSSLSRGGMLFEIDKSTTGGNAYLIIFKKQAVTPITSGPNKGEIFEETNVVTDIRPLGVVRKRGGKLWVSPPPNGEGCALVVQEPGQKHVVAAAYCPV